MKRILILIIVLITANQLYARLGETEEQIEARYGKPFKVSKVSNDLTEKIFKSKGFWVMVSFTKGISHGEYYRKLDKTELAFNEIAIFLKANSNGQEWIVISETISQKEWSNKAKDTIATWGKFSNDLSIIDKTQLEAFDQAKKLELNNF